MVVITDDEARARFGKRLADLFIEVAGIGPRRGLAQRVAARYNKAFSYQSVEKWLKGQSIPENVHISMICTDLGASVDWLFTGKGQRLIADREKGSWPFKIDQARFNKLTNGQKEAIDGTVRGLIIDYEDLHPTNRHGRRPPTP